VVCRAVLFGTFVLAGFLVVSAFETTTAAADTGCDPVESVTAPTACPATTSVTSLVDATVGQTTALVDSTAPVLTPAIGQADSAVRTATTVTTAITATVDTVVRDAGTAVSRTLDDPITNALSGSLTGAVSGTLSRTVSGTASAIAPVVPVSVPRPLPATPGVVATVTVTVSEVSTSTPPRPRPAPPADAASVAPRTTPAVAPRALTAPAAFLDGDCAFGVSGQRGQGSFQWSTASAARAGTGSQRPVGPLSLDFPAAPVGAVGSGNGTSQAGSSGGQAQGATVLPGRAAHDQRLASWSVNPDDVAPLRQRAQQPPVSPD
jgi:hypothetical protein